MKNGYWHWKKCMKVKATESCPTLQPHGLCSPWNPPVQNTGVGSLSLIHIQKRRLIQTLTSHLSQKE